MSRPTKENERISLFGRKLIAARNNYNHDVFSALFGASKTTVSRFLNGDSSPTVSQVWNFILNYAADHDMKMIDLNWLLNDNDRREGPIFTNAPTEPKETEQ